MKIIFRVILIKIVCTLFLSFSMAVAADKKPFSTSPPAKIAKKWRIGYLEGGPYKNYPKTLIATIDGLSELGWIEPVTFPQEDKKDTRKLWTWLTANVKGRYLEFVPDAYDSNGWDRELQKKIRSRLIRKLNEKQGIDLMIAMGTWAGQDLANNDHSVPTIVCSVSDAVASKIVKSVEDSGYDHVHAHLAPKRFERQIEAFHDVIGFEKLGVVYVDSLDGRSYAGLESIRNIAEKRKFKIVECPIEMHNTNETQGPLAVQCSHELAPKIDAFYIPMMSAVNSKTLPKILSAMNAHKVPTFSQLGSEDVRHGVLLGISDSANFRGVGKFHAETIAKIINGAKPRELSQIYEFPRKIAFNKATAKMIDLGADIYDLISEVAEEVYE